MRHISQIKLIAASAFFVLFLTAFPAQAVLFEVTSQTPAPALFQQFQVDLMLDPEGQSINAIEANVVFPEDLLALQELRDGESIVTFWVEKPTEGATAKEGLRQVHFSGVIPGGFEGVLSPFYKGVKPGKVLSLIFVAKEMGQGSIQIQDQKAYLNDGQGTLVQSKAMPHSFKVGKDIVVAPIPIPKDEDAPESFTPEIVQDATLFEGKHFLVFSAKDKISGIAAYEVAERKGEELKDYTRLSWQEVQSPYVLGDQALKSFIYVKATDRAGNERIAVLPPSYPLQWYEISFLWVIIGAVILFAAYLLLWRKKH